MMTEEFKYLTQGNVFYDVDTDELLVLSMINYLITNRPLLYIGEFD